MMDYLNLNESWSWSIPGGKIHWDKAEYIYQLVDGGSVDCVITDPPYWTLNKWREMGTTTRLGGALKEGDRDKRKFFETIDYDGLIQLVDECARVLKKDGHCWIMSDGQTLPWLLGYATHGDAHDFEYVKPYPVIKRAKTGGYKQGMGYHGRCSHEYVVFLAKKKHRKFNDLNWPDVFEFVWDGDSESKSFTPDNKPYPTAKPLEMFKRWIELSTKENDVVFDPFMGSGTTIAAANLLGRRFIGMDKSKLSIHTTYNRLLSQEF
jgi:site-specific DNA-methyltransferase (adenine-specific)